jgi:hypothetical protein
MAAFRFHIKSDLDEIKVMTYNNVRDEAHARSILDYHQALDKHRPEFKEDGTPNYRAHPGEVVKVERVTTLERPANMPDLMPNVK